MAELVAALVVAGVDPLWELEEPVVESNLWPAAEEEVALARAQVVPSPAEEVQVVL